MYCNAKLKRIFALVFLTLLTACDLGNIFQGFGSGLQIVPGSTTVVVGQSGSFQASGGTPPYQFNTSGIGTIDSSGNFTAGNTATAGQVSVTDSANNTAYASVTVVQSTFSSNEMRRPGSIGTPLQEWQPLLPTQNPTDIPIYGQIVGVDEKQLDSHGNLIKSAYIETNQKPKIIREDILVENKQKVAVRALVEDQFVVKLQSSLSEQDLLDVLTKMEAHISKKLPETRTYLVSLNPNPDNSLKEGINSRWIEKRKLLKQALQKLGDVSPNYIFIPTPLPT